MLRQLIVAPFISYSLGQFRTASRRQGNSSLLFEGEEWETSAEIADKAFHQWLLFGLRFAFTP